MVIFKKYIFYILSARYKLSWILHLATHFVDIMKMKMTF